MEDSKTVVSSKAYPSMGNPGALCMTFRQIDRLDSLLFLAVFLGYLSLLGWVGLVNLESFSNFLRLGSCLLLES